MAFVAHHYCLHEVYSAVPYQEWIFDSADGVPRLLRSRSGHHLPPTTIQYYGQDGQWILSGAGDRSLRAFSVIRDSQSVELSQGSRQ